MRRFLTRASGRLTREWHNIAYRFWRLAGGRGKSITAPILMIGCDRSGTTIASKLFATHPDVVNFSEARDVWDPRTAVDPNADHHWTAEMLTPGDADRIRSRFEFQRRIAGAARLLNKHNRNSVRIEYLRSVFPDAYLIHMIRDGRAVVQSITHRIANDRHRRGFPMGRFTKPPQWRELLRDEPVEQASLQWRAIVTYILDHAAAFGERYIECRYEDLCRDCRGTMGSLYRACDLRDDADVLAALPESLAAQNHKWRDRLTGEQIRCMEEIQGPLLTRLGYQVGRACEGGVAAASGTAPASAATAEPRTKSPLKK